MALSTNRLVGLDVWRSGGITTINESIYSSKRANKTFFHRSLGVFESQIVSLFIFFMCVCESVGVRVGECESE